MSVLEGIQETIVSDIDNFGDHSVCGDDLQLAAAAAILLWLDRSDLRDDLVKEAEARREYLLSVAPRLGILPPRIIRS